MLAFEGHFTPRGLTVQSSFLGKRLAVLAALTAFSLPMVLPRVALADDPAADPNAPGVARISIVQGSVAVQRGDSASPVEAAVNAPVLGADYLTTGDSSRAEVQFDEVSSVRLGDNVQMRFTRIDPGDRELQLAEGTVEVRMLRGDDGTATVDTPSVSVRTQDGGSYRVSVDADGRTSVTVRNGAASIVTPQGEQTLQPGTTLIASGTAADPQIDTSQAIAMDGFDAFNQDCDSHEQVALSDPHDVAPQVQGIADLDNDGRWVDDSSDGYGQAWIPSDVPADWAPYRDGRWAWEDAYGWTWVGSEPWGWAPYHYGRWYHSPRFGWAWYPGTYAPWAPAYVAFFGFNVGAVDLALGFGDVGWLPIGPREAFVPWWGRGYAFRDSVFIGNYAAINGYRNARWGITSVSHERFLAGDFRSRVAMSPERLRDARFETGRLALVPTTANLRYSDRNVSVRVTARTAFADRSFAGRAQPVARIPFAEQRSAVASGRTIERPATRTSVGAAGSAYGRAATTRSEGYGTTQRSESVGTQQRNEGYGTTQRSDSVGTQQRTYAAPANGRTDVTPRTNDPWSRFNASRGEAAGASGTARTYQAPRATDGTSSRSYGRSDTTYGRSTTTPSYGRTTTTPSYGRTTTTPSYGRTTTTPYAGSNGRVEQYDGNRSTNAYPSRVQTYDGARTGSQQHSWTTSQPSYSAPQRSSTAPAYNTQRSYGSPSYSAPQRSYSAPSYNTQRSYSAPQRSYSAPQRSYSAPQRSYSAPQRSYSAPQRSYSAPQRSYSAPQRSAPAQSRATARPQSHDTHTHD